MHELRVSSWHLATLALPIAAIGCGPLIPIDGTGTVPAVRIDKSTVPDPDVATCLANLALRWTFPKPAGGADVIISYPFVLEPG